MKNDHSLVRRFLFSVVVRPLMFVVIAGVFWGTAMLGVWIVSLLRLGLAETWEAVRPHELDPASAANFVLPLLALLVWMLAAVAWAQRRAAARHQDVP